MPEWLKDAVFYEIYPQSFNDSNNDGIGDIAGMMEKLDYVKSLGCNALWLNPLFDSPFKDAGYDVRDYKKVAERYGTNEDLVRFISAAHEKGIRVLLDLVPGHTSEEHEWFQKSREVEVNEYTDRYVWTNGAFVGIKDHPYIAGESRRDAAYMLNFFKAQPALNYGWGVVEEPWQKAVDDPACIATREDMKDIMRFWLDQGCDGFRVDMADSLVKSDDEVKHHTAAIWRNVREMLDEEYPEAAIVAEWSNPYSCVTLGGFHMDFYLDHWNNGYNTLARDYEPNPKGDNSFFRKGSKHDITRFLDDYMPKYHASKDYGYISMFTCNHDTPRPARTLSVRELKLFYAFIFTMPGVPFLYYGDEIGMPYLENLVSVEGGFHRTGSRSPMHWNHGKNYGFSEADEIYIRQAENSVCVEDQESDPDSLLNTVRALIQLRHSIEDLQADADFNVIYGEKEKLPFVYARGNHVLVVNPDTESHSVQLPLTKKKLVYAIGEVTLDGTILKAEPQSFAVFEAPAAHSTSIAK